MISVNGIDDEAWDELVNSAAEGTVFHSTAWLNASPHDFIKLGLFLKQRLIAGAVLQVDERGQGTLGTLTPYLGLLFSASVKPDELQADWRTRAASTLAEAIQCAVVEAKFFISPWCERVQPFLVRNFQAQLFYTMVVPTFDLEQTWGNFTPVLRRNIRAAQRVGLVTQRSADPNTVIKLACASFARQGKEVWFSLEEVESCLRRLATLGQAAFFVTYSADGLPIAAVAICWDHHRSYYILGGHDHLHAHRGGMSLTLWQALQFTCEEVGLAEMDLEGSHIASIARFFGQFGGHWLPFYLVTAGTAEL
jgi:hypothetical protein